MPVAPRRPLSGILTAGLALAPALTAAQGTSPRLALAVTAGVGAATTAATGQVVSATVVAGGSGATIAPTTSTRSLALRLDTRTMVGGEARVRLGRTGRWALLGDLARGTGSATLRREQLLTLASNPDVFATGEQIGRYDGVTTWRGALGVARVLALPGPWQGDVSVAGTLGRVRAAGDPACPVLPPAGGGPGGALCEDLLRPTFALTTPGAAFGAGLESPAWRSVRARARVGVDVVRTDGDRLVRDLDGSRGAGALLPAGVSLREEGAGPRVRALPSASLGVAVGVGR